MKRDRGSFDVDAEVFESFAALLRQSTARAVDRLRLQRANHAQQQQRREMGRGGVQQQQQTSVATVRPIDRLIIQYCMYYLDLSRLPASHYVRLAQEIVTSSSERILLPRYFAKVSSLPQLCEALVEENTAEVMQDTLTEVEAFVEAREAIAGWISEEGNGDDDDGGSISAVKPDVKRDGEEDDHFANEEAESNASHCGDSDAAAAQPGIVTEEPTTDLAALLYRSTEYWVRVHNFIHALAEGSARMNACPLQPRYERELMGLLHTLTVSPHMTAAAATNAGDRTRPGAVAAATTTREAAPKLGETMSVVKQEDADLTQGESHAATVAAAMPVTAGAEAGDGEVEEDDNAVVSEEEEEVMDDRVAERQAVVTAVLGDVLALASCPSAAVPPSSPATTATVAATTTTTSNNASSSTSNNGSTAANSLFSTEMLQSLRGVNASFYAMIHARLAIMVARHRLHGFGRRAAHAAPALTRAQEQLLTAEQQRQAELMQCYQSGGAPGGADGAAIGVPVDYIPDDRYYDEMLERQNDFVGEDEELYKDEVVDYYLRKSAAAAQQDASSPHASGGPRSRRRGAYGAMPNGQELVKPHRFCKVKTGFTWTQYNRTHYDSRTNPPPRMVMWYEFTLFYPALVHTKRDMRHIFHIEDTPRGPNDDYCLLVFSVGPPYADVAYRIVKKQWDTRRGGVRISFDATGKYKLFFRFASSNYRR